MYSANLYPSIGLWKVRFHLDAESEYWCIEFYDPNTWCQTIPVPLIFTGKNEALNWLFNNVLESHFWEEKYENWYQGNVASEAVGQFVLDLHFASRCSEEDSTPWYYSSYFGQGCFPVDPTTLLKYS